MPTEVTNIAASLKRGERERRERGEREREREERREEREERGERGERGEREGEREERERGERERKRGEERGERGERERRERGRRERERRRERGRRERGRRERGRRERGRRERGERERREREEREREEERERLLYSVAVCVKETYDIERPHDSTIDSPTLLFHSSLRVWSKQRTVQSESSTTTTCFLTCTMDWNFCRYPVAIAAGLTLPELPKSTMSAHPCMGYNNSTASV